MCSQEFRSQATERTSKSKDLGAKESKGYARALANTVQVLQGIWVGPGIERMLRCKRTARCLIPGPRPLAETRRAARNLEARQAWNLSNLRASSRGRHR